MRHYVTVFLIIISTGVFGQSAFNKLIKNIKIAKLPYSSQSEQTRLWFVYSEKQTKLHLADSTFIVEKLKSIPPLIVNPDGGTGFGDLDYQDFNASFLFRIREAAIVRVVKLNSNYLLHIVISEGDGLWHGILAYFSPGGEIKNWIYSNGSANGGNPHGNIQRDFKILPNKIIQITEGAYGDNTETYGFTALYKIAPDKLVLLKRKLKRGSATGK